MLRISDCVHPKRLGKSEEIFGLNIDLFLNGKFFEHFENFKNYSALPSSSPLRHGMRRKWTFDNNL